VPPGSEVVATESGIFIVIDRLAVAVFTGLLESVTVMVKLEVPMEFGGTVGVPVMAPVEVLRLSPAGREPDVSDQV
jgi:hypothetical protein